MRHLLGRAPLLAVALAWPLASISACFNDVGGVTSAATGTTSTGGSSGSTSGGDDGSSGSSTGGTTSGGATSSGSSSAASTSAATTAIETSGGGTTTGDTSGDTTGDTTGPALCMPDMMMADPCQLCVGPACCDQLLACTEDVGCACFVACLGINGDAPKCADQCNVNPQAGVTGELILCMVQACSTECNLG